MFSFSDFLCYLDLMLGSLHIKILLLVWFFGIAKMIYDLVRWFIENNK